MIAHQRETAACELNANLMAAACMQTDVHQTLGTASKCPVLQTGKLNTLAFLFDYKYFVFPAVLKEQIFPVTGFGGCTVYQRHIFFDHGSFLHGFGQGSCGTFGAGIYHHATYIFIQPVDWENVSAQFRLQCFRNFCLRIHSHRFDTDCQITVTV